jgi:RHS repeat-associated protein
VCRRSITYTLTYDAENRLKSVTQGGQTTTFTYDGNGRLVKRDTVTDTVVYVGSHYEARFEEQDIPEDLDDDCLVTVIDIMLVVARWGMTEADPDWDPRYDFDGDGEITVADIMQVAAHWRETCEQLAEVVKYYTLGGRRVAMRKVPEGQPETLYYLFTDHLGSTSVSYRASDGQSTTQRYYPWGTIRPGPSNALPTDYTFTGQRLDESTGLMYYGARYYDPTLGRFISADSIVPNPGNPQDLNRYSYARNNPLAYVDSGGDIPIPVIIGVGIAILKAVDWGWTAWDTYQSLRVLQNPESSRIDRLLANLNIALAVGLEAAEPDEPLPVAVPADDVARRAALRAAREALEAGSREGFEQAFKNLPDWLKPMLRGVLTEERMLEAMGYADLPRRAVKGFVEGRWVKTVPDYLDESAKVMGEIKDVAELWGTKQIRAQLAWAEEMAKEGWTYVIHVRPDTEVARWLKELAETKPWFKIVPNVVSVP